MGYIVNLPVISSSDENGLSGINVNPEYKQEININDSSMEFSQQTNTFLVLFLLYSLLDGFIRHSLMMF